MKNSFNKRPIWNPRNNAVLLKTRNFLYHLQLKNSCCWVCYTILIGQTQDIQDQFPRHPRPISSSQSPDLLSSSFVNFLSYLLHSLHLSTSPFSNRCEIGNFAKLPLENFLSPRISNFPAFVLYLNQLLQQFSHCLISLLINFQAPNRLLHRYPISYGHLSLQKVL